MVVLGFRPKVAPIGSAVSLKNAKKQQSNSENIDMDINQKLSVTVQNKKKNLTLSATKSKSNSNSNSKPISNYVPQKQQISSNWKRLKSLNILTSEELKSSTSQSNKMVSDSEWFGVRDVQEFAAGSEDQILRENVPTATLFPPPPAGLSPEKLRQPCKFVALDCEMVGTGLRGYESILARVSVVNFHGIELMDVYVKPTRKITDYRTAVSGITPGHLIPSSDSEGLNSFGQVLLSLPELQELLVPLLQDRIVVGHALNNDFSALLLSSNHPRKSIRDTSRYGPFRALSNGRSPALKMLAARILGVKIQGSSHDSVDDARIAMLLYRAVKSQWENMIFTHGDRKTKRNDPKDSKDRRRGSALDSGTDEDESVANGSDKDKFIFNSILQ